MKISEIIFEMDDSRRSFLSKLGKGAAAASLASAGFMPTSASASQDDEQYLKAKHLLDRLRSDIHDVLGVAIGLYNNHWFTEIQKYLYRALQNEDLLKTYSRNYLEKKVNELIEDLYQARKEARVPLDNIINELSSYPGIKKILDQERRDTQYFIKKYENYKHHPFAGSAHTKIQKWPEIIKDTKDTLDLAISFSKQLNQ